MKTLISTCILTIATISTPSWAAEKCSDTVNISVNGLVCDFCARALEKVFGERDDVEGINVDLDKGSVIVNMKPGQTVDDATLTKLITDSGYNVTNIDKGC